MKTAMQELSEWLETPNVWGENNFSVRSKVKQLLEKEKCQLQDAFSDGLEEDSVGFDNMRTPIQYFIDTYTNE